MVENVAEFVDISFQTDGEEDGNTKTRLLRLADIAIGLYVSHCCAEVPCPHPEHLCCRAPISALPVYPVR
jgi:hypothetical protein